MKHFLTLCLLCSLVLCIPARGTEATNLTLQAGQEDVYAAVSRLLQEHVAEGQVNYRALQKDKDQLHRLVQLIADYNLGQASSAEKKAFYLNAYNVLVLQQVVKHYPVKSVMDVAGFFDKQQFRVAGEHLTLNQLEKQKLLLPYRDARVHFALVCAAKSCPPLLNKAYTPAQVEEQLEAQAKKALQDPDFIQVQPKAKRVLVSELFKWYKEDFLQQAPSVSAYINRYRNKPLPGGYQLSYYPYNWALNDSSR